MNFQALKHDRKFHTGVKDYECRVCEAEVTDIAVHMKVHVTEKEFVCSHCPARFRHKNSLIRHMCQHTGERPYACQRCSAAFIAPHRHGCQMAIASFSFCVWPSGLLDYGSATLRCKV